MNIEKFIEEGRRQLELDPTDGARALGVAAYLMDFGRWEEAENVARTGLKNCPGVKALRRILGLALCAQNKFEEGTAELEGHFNETKDASSLICIADSYFKRGMMSEAREYASLSIFHEPTSQAYAVLANAYASQGDAVAAHENYSHAVELDQTNASARADFALFLLMQGARFEALEECNKALEYAPCSAKTLFVRSNCWLSVEEPDEALKDALAAIVWAEGAPSRLQSEYFCWLGQVYLSLDESHQALHAYRRAYEQDECNEDACVGYARALYDVLENEAAARAVLEEGLRRMPSSANIATVLSNFCIDSKAAEAALELLGRTFAALEAEKDGMPPVAFAAALAKLMRARAEAYLFAQRYEDAVQELLSVATPESIAMGRDEGPELFEFFGSPALRDSKFPNFATEVARAFDGGRRDFEQITLLAGVLLVLSNSPGVEGEVELLCEELEEADPERAEIMTGRLYRLRIGRPDTATRRIKNLLRPVKSKDGGEGDGRIADDMSLS